VSLSPSLLKSTLRQLLHCVEVICYVNSCSVLSIHQHLNSDNWFHELIPRPDEPNRDQDKTNTIKTKTSAVNGLTRCSLLSFIINETQTQISSTYWYQKDYIIVMTHEPVQIICEINFTDHK